MSENRISRETFWPEKFWLDGIFGSYMVDDGVGLSLIGHFSPFLMVISKCRIMILLIITFCGEFGFGVVRDCRFLDVDRESLGL